MRFVDGPTAEVSIEIAASPDRIWPVLTDIELPVRQSDELQAVEWLGSVDAPQVGARFRGVMDNGRARWTTESEITVCDEPHRFEWTVLPLSDDDQPVATWGFRLRANDEGSELVQYVRLGPGRSGLTMAIEKYPEREDEIIDGRLQQLTAAMQRNLDVIRAEVEHDG